MKRRSSRTTALVASMVALGTSGCMSTPNAEDLIVAGTTRVALTDADARAGFRSYVAAINAALAGEGLDELELRTDARCPCVSLIAYIRRGLAEGGAFEGARFGAEDVRVLDLSDAVATVRARVAVSRYDVRTADGLVVRRQPAETYTAVYRLQFTGEGWVALHVEPPGE